MAAGEGDALADVTYQMLSKRVNIRVVEWSGSCLVQLVLREMEIKYESD